jgi:hypothetical protein
MNGGGVYPTYRPADLEFKQISMLINKLDGSVPNPGFAEIPKTEIKRAVESTVDITVKGAKVTGVARVTFEGEGAKTIAALTNYRDSVSWLVLDAEGGKTLGELITDKQALVKFPNSGTLYSVPAKDRDGKPRTFVNSRGVTQQLYNTHLDGVRIADLIGR